MIKKIPDLAEFKALLMPLAIFLVIFLSAALFLKPRILAIPEAQKELSLQQSRLAKLTTKMAFLEGLQEAELEKKTKTALAILPAEKDLPGALLAIRNLTSTAGLELQAVQVEPGEESLEFKITLGGDWAQFENFLARVEEAAPLVRVTNLEISSSATAAAEADLVLKNFFLPLPATLGTSESVLAPITSQEEEIYQRFASSVFLREEPSSFSLPAGRENPFVF